MPAYDFAASVGNFSCNLPIKDIAIQYYMWGLYAGVIIGGIGALVIYYLLMREGYLDAPVLPD